MVYEKKREPLARWEVIMAGLSLQYFIIIYNIIPVIALSADCVTIVLGAEMNSSESVSEAHDCILEHRDGWLTFCSLLLVGYPVIIGHIYFDKRVSDTIFSFLNLDAFRWLLWASWAIAGTILCTLIPALGIFISYYDWEFDTNIDVSGSNQYIGYALQLQFFHLLAILWDCTFIPLGLAAAVPWLQCMCYFFGWCPSKYYKLSDDKMKQLGAIKWFVACIMIVLICICLFASIGDSLDFGKNGFWSYEGGSQWLGLILSVVWQCTSITYVIFAYNFKKYERNFEQNVELLVSKDDANGDTVTAVTVEMAGN